MTNSHVQVRQMAAFLQRSGMNHLEMLMWYFLQVFRCPSQCQTNSAKALKAWKLYENWQLITSSDQSHFNKQLKYKFETRSTPRVQTSTKADHAVHLLVSLHHGKNKITEKVVGER